ncbi:MAG: pseudouridine synthase [Flavobacteriales bacterium]|nr:pseudouridine synthase [Flavobacteriales bacterium]MCC6939223.1 pseudouridine synthase [Flavobacteriales bacterium]
MTDRSERNKAPKGRKSDPRRPGAGGKPPRSASPRGDERTKEEPKRSDSDEKPRSKRFGRRPPSAGRGRGDSEKRTTRDDTRAGSKSTEGKERPEGGWKRPFGAKPDRPGKPFRKSAPKRSSDRDRGAETPDDGRIRLNRYLSNAGVASRREADQLIQAGVVSVNGKIVTELGTKVGPNDKVQYGGQRLSREKKRYVLLNKPKDFLTTTDDPRDRRTVMALVEKACTERIYPVGRLDRNTTGLLMLTNDGDLARKLTHPSEGAEKIYHVTLDKNVAAADLIKLTEGVMLDDGPAKADEARFVDGAERKEVGLKLHMGKNRVVRRMFEALGYDVVKLDRVIFAGLTKKDLPRGRWRHLTDKEVLFLTKRKSS